MSGKYFKPKNHLQMGFRAGRYRASLRWRDV